MKRSCRLLTKLSCFVILPSQALLHRVRPQKEVIHIRTGGRDGQKGRDQARCRWCEERRKGRHQRQELHPVGDRLSRDQLHRGGHRPHRQPDAHRQDVPSADGIRRLRLPDRGLRRHQQDPRGRPLVRLPQGIHDAQGPCGRTRERDGARRRCGRGLRLP